MQVRPDRPSDAAALEPALAVVPEPGDDAPERHRIRVEPRPAGVVLEPGDRPPFPGVELALDEDVADHPPVAGDRLVREQADARLLDAVGVEVEAAEQLVAAADGEQRRAVRDFRPQRVALGGEVGRDQRLLAVLAAADVEEVDLAARHVVARPDRAHVELVPAPARPALEHGDVAAVGVDVEVVRVEVADDDPRHAARSQ